MNKMMSIIQLQPINNEKENAIVLPNKNQNEFFFF